MLHAQASPIVDKLMQDLAPSTRHIAIIGPFAQQHPIISEIHIALVTQSREDVFGDSLELLDATDCALRVLVESNVLRVNLTHCSSVYATHVRTGLPVVIHKLAESDFTRFIASAYPNVGV